MLLCASQVGAKRLLAGSMGLASGLILALALVESSPKGREIAIIVLAVAFNAFATAGWNSLDAMSTHVFPRSLRATAFGILTGTGRVASLIAQFVNGSLSQQVPLMLGVTCMCMVMGCIGALCIRETATSRESLRTSLVSPTTDAVGRL